MKTLSLLLVAPSKMKGLKEEIESIKSWEGEQVLIQILKAFTDLKEFNRYAENLPQSDAAFLIFESITDERINQEKAQSEILEDIRKIKCQNYEARITVIQQTEKEKDLSFVNELMKLDVQNFYFASTFNLDNIAGWIFGTNKTLKDNLQYVKAQMKKPEKEIVTKEITKYVEVPVSSRDAKIVTPPSPNPLPPKGKNENIKYIVGIIGMSEGTGATSLCVALSEYLAKLKMKVLLLDRTENKHLSMIQIRGQEIRTDTLSDIEVKNYDYVLIDFGKLVTWEEGRFSLSADMTNEKKMERNFCNCIVLVGSSLPWKLREAMTYIEEPTFAQLTKEWLFYFTGEQNRLFNDVKKQIAKARKVLVSFEETKPIERVNQFIVNGRVQEN